MPDPAVSVVLPTYNRASTIARAIDSVLHQTFPDFELIIVDDGSTDGTRSVLAQYSTNSRIVIVPAPHRGCAGARNTGLERARGRYVAFQDSDDEWAPQKLAAAMAALDAAGPGTGVFYSDMQIMLPDGRSGLLASPDVTRGVLVDDRTLDYAVRCIGIQSAVIRKDCLDAVGGFDEALPRLIDLDLFIRLAEQTRFERSRTPLVTYHFGTGISADTQALVSARRHLLRKYGGRLRQQRHHLAGQYFYLGLALEENGNRLAAQPFLLRALLTAPMHAGLMRRLSASARASRSQWRATVSTGVATAARLVTATAGTASTPDTGGRDAT